MKKKWCLIGIPDDTGVKNNRGRIGAAKGPAVFRKYFTKLSGKIEVLEQMEDLGDADINSLDIEESHEMAFDIIQENHGEYKFSIVVGGGHDHGFTQLKGIQKSIGNKKKLGCINIDAHLDLRSDRPKILSGSPFYMALEEGILDGERLIEFGIQHHCNGPEFWKYAEKQGVEVRSFDELRNGKALEAFKQSLEKLKKSSNAIVISLDLDSIQAAYAPGVSAPAMEGFDPSEIMEMVEAAAREKKVISLGIFELNPNYDSDDRTSRLASIIAYNFARVKLGGKSG